MCAGGAENARLKEIEWERGKRGDTLSREGKKKLGALGKPLHPVNCKAYDKEGSKDSVR